MNVFGGLGGIVFEENVSFLCSRSAVDPLNPTKNNCITVKNKNYNIISIKNTLYNYI